MNILIRGGRKLIEIKPCPFCGSNMTTVRFVSPQWMLKKLRGRYVAAGCPECGASTKLLCGNFKTGSPLLNKADAEKAKEEAAEAWNRRANDV